MRTRLLCGLAAALSPVTAFAAEEGNRLDLTATGYGFIALAVFILAYALVISEEFLHLRKSKPMVVAAGIIWALVGIAYAAAGDHHTAGAALQENIREYAEMFLFLLAAMTYVNVMEERLVFARLRATLVSRGFSFVAVFWLTGILSFFISAVADNLTTALLMGAVVMAVGVGNTGFIVVACINVVVAANAGGAFSPFGDITTLMVWQKQILPFWDFFDLFVPSFVNWLVPAILMGMAVPKGKPAPQSETVRIKHGGVAVIALFGVTLVLAVSAHNFLHLPPVIGMMTGLGLLKFYGFHLKRRERKQGGDVSGPEQGRLGTDPEDKAFDIFAVVARAEWDTLMFFYGVVLCVGGLGTIGYLAMVSHGMYTGLGPTWANVLVGVISAVVDNIPVMFAVLTMHPEMADGQWLLVTLTAGVGGSLLSVGSAAGVALMGQSRGLYTFFSHLRWSWAIALGYAASIWIHFIVNAHLM